MLAYPIAIKAVELRAPGAFDDFAELLNC